MEKAERRIELIHMMRNEQNENINRMQRREQILYPDKKITGKDNIDSVSLDKNWGFYLRLIISIAFFLTFFYMDISNTDYLGISADMVNNMISDTFDLKAIAFMR